MTRRLLAVVTATAFVATIVVANWLTTHYGFVPVTDVPIGRNAHLRALGNGVVPLQAATAIGDLLDRIGGRADAAALGTP